MLDCLLKMLKMLGIAGEVYVADADDAVAICIQIDEF